VPVKFAAFYRKPRQWLLNLGDSHAGHWRAALDYVAKAKGWRGLSITHSSCPLQKAVRDIPEPRRTSCARWKEDVFKWFEGHPEVSVVFVAGLTGFTGVVPRPGRGRFETSVQSYMDAWRALPRSVSRIVVLRDTPKVRGNTDDCVTRAVARRRAPGPACAVSRSFALERDPAMTAAARVAGSRVARMDLTRYFCDTRCYPVVGGVLVLRDSHHMTGAFSGTLGPYLLRAYDGIGARSLRNRGVASTRSIHDRTVG
jgi:hypothetical protein